MYFFTFKLKSFLSLLYQLLKCYVILFIHLKGKFLNQQTLTINYIISILFFSSPKVSIRSKSKKIRNPVRKVRNEQKTFGRRLRWSANRTTSGSGPKFRSSEKRRRGEIRKKQIRIKRKLKPDENKQIFGVETFSHLVYFCKADVPIMEF